MRRHFAELKQLTGRQLDLIRDGKPANANEVMVEAARIRRSAPDYDGMMAEEHESRNREELQRITTTRDGLTLLSVIIGLAIILIGASLISRI